MRYGVWSPIPMFASGVRKWMPGRNNRRITAVVIHRMEGTLDGSDSWLRNPRSGSASTHFGVGAMGWLNRLLRRWQIRQWVDTAHTAYGWAARPTDVPTDLARRVLPPDLYDSRADLNWQVIAVEVEGFWTQPWAPGLANKVQELLNAIARAHGPLVVMAHTDCSTKPCPGMVTFKAAMPGLYGSRLSLPDTAQPTPGYEGFPLAFYNEAPRTATVLAGKPIRTGPSTSHRTITTRSTPTPVRLYLSDNGEILGGTAKWYAYPIGNPAGKGHVLGWSPRIDLKDFSA